MKWFGVFLFFAGCAVGSSIGTDPADKAAIATLQKKVAALEAVNANSRLIKLEDNISYGAEFQRLTDLANSYLDSADLKDMWFPSVMVDSFHAYTRDSIGNIVYDSTKSVDMVPLYDSNGQKVYDSTDNQVIIPHIDGNGDTVFIYGVLARYDSAWTYRFDTSWDYRPEFLRRYRVADSIIDVRNSLLLKLFIHRLTYDANNNLVNEFHINDERYFILPKKWY